MEALVRRPQRRRLVLATIGVKRPQRPPDPHRRRQTPTGSLSKGQAGLASSQRDRRVTPPSVWFWKRLARLRAGGSSVSAGRSPNAIDRALTSTSTLFFLASGLRGKSWSSCSAPDQDLHASQALNKLARSALGAPTARCCQIAHLTWQPVVPRCQRDLGQAARVAHE